MRIMRSRQRAATMWQRQRAGSALEREVRREVRRRARREVALERERSAGMVLAAEDLLRETWEGVLDEVVVDVWLEWEAGVQRQQRQERATGRRRRRWCPAACGVTQRSSTGVSNAEEGDDMREKGAWGYTSDPKGGG